MYLHISRPSESGGLPAKRAVWQANALRNLGRRVSLRDAALFSLGPSEPNLLARMERRQPLVLCRGKEAQSFQTFRRGCSPDLRPGCALAFGQPINKIDQLGRSADGGKLCFLTLDHGICLRIRFRAFCIRNIALKSNILCQGRLPLSLLSLSIAISGERNGSSRFPVGF